MKSKNIVFDIDGTIVDEIGFIVKFAPEYLKTFLGSDFNIIDKNGSTVAEIFGLNVFFSEKGFSHEKVKEKCKEINDAFWKKHFIKYILLGTRIGAKETINRLYNDGDRIIFITLRGKCDETRKEKRIDKFIRINIIPLLTKLQLARNGIKYHELMMARDIEEKLEFIRTRNVDIVVEDTIEIIRKIGEPIRTVCITCGHNVNEILPCNAVRTSGYKRYKVYRLIKEGNSQRRR